MGAVAIAVTWSLLKLTNASIVVVYCCILCRREKFCDFCNCELPDWKNVLTPTLGNAAPAVMNVNFDNKTYSFHVAPGGSNEHLIGSSTLSALSFSRRGA